MNELLKMIKERRSIRNYRQEPISKEQKQQLLEAVQASQSWSNTQCWELVIVEDPELRKKIQQAVPSQNPAYRAVVDAAMLVIICGRTNLSGCAGGHPATSLGDYMMYDLGIATQNLCMMAHALELATVVIAWMDHEQIKKAIGCPAGYEVVSVIPIGHPGHKGGSSMRKELTQFTHLNTF